MKDEKLTDKITKFPSHVKTILKSSNPKNPNPDKEKK